MIVIACFLLLIAGTGAEDCIPEIFEASYKVYYGWPFTYTCLSVSEDPDFYYYDDEFGTYSCIITDVSSGTVVKNTSFDGSFYEELPEDGIRFVIENVTDKTPTVYETRLQKNETCWIQKITLEPMHLPTETCDENLANTRTINHEKTLGAAFEARCDVPDDSDGIPKKLVERTEGTTKFYWLHDCQEKLPENAGPYDGTSLTFTNISYEANPGIYTCVVEHNGMKRYRIHHKICVKPRISSSISMKCSNQTASVGQDVEVECLIDAGRGIDTTAAFSGRFNMLNSTGQLDFSKENVSCVAYVGHVGIAPDERISCELMFNARKKCFDVIPSPKELEAQKTALRMVYRIKNVQESDFGIYRASINRVSIGDTALFALFYDREPGLSETNKLLTICIATIGGLALFCLLLWILCEIELRWIWFKMCKPTEKGNKKYLAYVAYYYNKEMTITPPAQLEAFVMNLDTRLRSLGGEVYDRCRDPGTDQYTAGSITSKLGECHRIVIILTPEYVNDHWSVYEAYEAWKSVIEHEIKIIFILFPNTMSAIKELPENSKIALKKALKRHKVIEWEGTMPFTRRMRIQLGLLMPKLPAQTSVEMQPPDQQQNGLNGTAGAKHNGHGANHHQTDNNQNIYENNV